MNLSRKIFSILTANLAQLSQSLTDGGQFSGFLCKSQPCWLCVDSRCGLTTTGLSVWSIWSKKIERMAKKDFPYSIKFHEEPWTACDLIEKTHHS